MIKVLKARNQYEINALVDDYIEWGYVLRTNIYKCWYAPQETKWRAKVEAPRGQLEIRTEQGGWK
jgi:hypothetical protein